MFASRPELRSDRLIDQFPPARFRQESDGEEDQQVGAGGEDADGSSQPEAGREQADDPGDQGADAAAEIVAKALPRPAHRGRVEFAEIGADAAEDAAGKETER